MNCSIQEIFGTVAGLDAARYSSLRPPPPGRASVLLLMSFAYAASATSMEIALHGSSIPKNQIVIFVVASNCETARRIVDRRGYVEQKGNARWKFREGPDVSLLLRKATSC